MGTVQRAISVGRLRAERVEVVKFEGACLREGAAAAAAAMAAMVAEAMSSKSDSECLDRC